MLNFVKLKMHMTCNVKIFQNEKSYQEIKASYTIKNEKRKKRFVILKYVISPLNKFESKKQTSKYRD